MEILACAIGYLLPKSDLWRTILLCLVYELIPKLLKRTTLPPFPTATVLLLPMLMRDLDLHAKVGHALLSSFGIGIVGQGELHQISPDFIRLQKA